MSISDLQNYKKGTDHTDVERSTDRNDHGFTLVEVMVVMVIIGLLTTFVVLNLLPVQDKAMVEKARADLRQIEQAAEFYRLDMRVYPSELADLQTLPAGKSGAANYRKGGYIKKLSNDPWGNPYVYIFPGTHGDFDVLSYGADGQEGGEELAADIVNWNE